VLIMVFSASRLRLILRRVPLLAIAGIAAVLVGLPSAAGATFFGPADFARGGCAAGDSLRSCDLRLSLMDLHADFVERAAHDLDFEFPGRLSSVKDFWRDRFQEAHRDVAVFDGLARHPWIGAELDLSHFCRRDLPQTIAPEPGTALLLAGGLAGLSFVGRKRRV
jgi:hypothetical protein